MVKKHASLQSGEQVLQSVCAAQVLEPFSSVPETIALNEYLLFHHLLQKMSIRGEKSHGANKRALQFIEAACLVVRR